VAGIGHVQIRVRRLLGVNEKEAHRILDPDSAAKADRLEQALAVLGRKVHVSIEAA
jgi:hypothetical protein